MVCSVCHYLSWVLMIQSSLQLDIGKNYTADTHCNNLFISDNCNERLNLETKNQSKVLISASSSYDNLSVGPQHARWGKSKITKRNLDISNYFRLHHDDQGGAWCPLQPVSPDKPDQWLGMNLTTTHVINSLETQGRYANGSGQEYTTAYRVLYWREGMQKFREYRDSLGRVVRKILKY